MLACGVRLPSYWITWSEPASRGHAMRVRDLKELTGFFYIPRTSEPTSSYLHQFVPFKSRLRNRAISWRDGALLNLAYEVHSCSKHNSWRQRCVCPLPCNKYMYHVNFALATSIASRGNNMLSQTLISIQLGSSNRPSQDIFTNCRE